MLKGSYIKTRQTLLNTPVNSNLLNIKFFTTHVFILIVFDIRKHFVYMMKFLHLNYFNLTT